MLTQDLLVARLSLILMVDGLLTVVVHSLVRTQLRSTDQLLTMQDMLLNQSLQTSLPTELSFRFRTLLDSQIPFLFILILTNLRSTVSLMSRSLKLLLRILTSDLATLSRSSILRDQFTKRQLSMVILVETTQILPGRSQSSTYSCERRLDLLNSEYSKLYYFLVDE